ncbi:hypothetical protein J6590_049020, partial [Homalodisca vitripennis]
TTVIVRTGRQNLISIVGGRGFVERSPDKIVHYAPEGLENSARTVVVNDYRGRGCTSIDSLSLNTGNCCGRWWVLGGWGRGVSVALTSDQLTAAEIQVQTLQIDRHPLEDYAEESTLFNDSEDTDLWQTARLRLRKE